MTGVTLDVTVCVTLRRSYWRAVGGGRWCVLAAARVGSTPRLVCGIGAATTWSRWSRSVHPRFANLFAAAMALVLIAGCGGPTPSPTQTPDVSASPSPKPAAALPSPSPGLPVPSPSASPSPSTSPAVADFKIDDYPFAVMIDNIAEARPHFGLAGADVVYEAPAEAGIPRLMPIYLRAGGAAPDERIGPVRSTRHYFVSLANEYRAPLVHIGASPQGYDALSATGLPTVDEARGDSGFLRDAHRQAPHNAFVTSTSVRDVLRQRGGALKSTMGPIAFGAYVAGKDPATTVKIPYPGPEGYSVEYDYDSAAKLYMRIMDGQPHNDGSTGQQYAASSIVVEFADVEPIPRDTLGRVDVGLVGSGKGVLIAQDTQVPLTWSRASVREPTQFKRTDGAQFALPPGQVWIQIVPLQTQLSIT